MKKPKKTKSAWKKLVKEADDTFSEWIRNRDENEFGQGCSLCRFQKATCAAHLISRAKYSVRWDPLNVYAQCIGCNIRHEFHPQYYTTWWIARHGVEAYQDLFRRSNQIVKRSRQDMEDIIDRFKEAP